MNLVWHAAKKDVRRMALPVAIWIAFIVAPTVAFAWMPTPVHGDHLASALDGWSRLLAIWVQLLVALQVVIGYVLVGYLALEDPLIGSTAFWMTRPIGSGRLLGAKVLAAVLLFLVAPVIALFAVWLACGFGLIDMAMAAGPIVGRFGAMALAALTLASVVRTLPQFLLCTIAVGAAFMMTGIIPSPLWQPASMAVRIARELLVLGGMWPMLAIIAMHQYLTRRTRRTWTLVAAMLLFAALIRTTWAWEFPTRTAARRPVADATAARSIDVSVSPTFTQSSRNPKGMPNLVGTSAWNPQRFHAPVFARSPSGEVVMRSSGRWEAEAGLRILGFNESAAPVPWQLTMMGAPPAEPSPTLTGTLEVWGVRARVLGELPIRLGARFSHANGQTQIIGLQWHEGRLDRIVVQETEPHATDRAGMTANWTLRNAESIRHIDRYFVVNRAARTAHAAGMGDLGTVGMNAIAIRYRSLGFPWTEEFTPEKAILIKLRFESLDRFDVPLEVSGITSPPPHPRP